MTCIVGISQNGKVYMGGDSSATGGMARGITVLPKVFTVGQFVIGYTHSFRMGQLLQYHLDVRQQQDGETNERYMVVGFIEAVRTCLKNYGFAEISNNRESGGTFLVGYKGTLYEVYSDFQVNCDQRGIASVGSGSEFALGALLASEGKKPRKRIELALDVAHQLCVTVSPPYTFIEA